MFKLKMSTRNPPILTSHVSAQLGWFAVFPVKLPEEGGVEVSGKEPVLAWRVETFGLDPKRDGRIDRFDVLTPILASGSIGSEVYALQFGQRYYTGDERFDSKQELIEFFRKRLL